MSFTTINNKVIHIYITIILSIFSDQVLTPQKPLSI